MSHTPNHKDALGPLVCYSENPTNVRFETQEVEEKIVLFLRQHLIVNFSWLLITIIMLVTPTIIFPIFMQITGLSLNVPIGYIIVGTLFWYLATAGFVLANFLSWFFNIYIVTDRRVIDIDFKYLLYKHTAEAELNKIQDLSYISGGLVATIFNYGNVLVETAGEIPNIEFDSVPHPGKVVEAIRNLTGKVKKHL